MLNNIKDEPLVLPKKFNNGYQHVKECFKHIPEVYQSPIRALFTTIDNALRDDGLAVLGLFAHSALTEELAGTFSLEAHKDISLYYHAVSAYGFALVHAFEGDNAGAETIVDDARGELSAAIAAGLMTRKSA